MEKDEKTLRDEIFAKVSKRYEKMPECPEKDMVLHLLRVRVNSVPYADLKIMWFEICGEWQ